MSAPHIPPIPTVAITDREGRPTIEQHLWMQQLALSRGPWIPYTPAVVGMTAVTINSAAYVAMGKTIAFRISVTATGSGAFPTITLPFNTQSTSNGQACYGQQILAGVPIPLGLAVGQATNLLKIALDGGVAPVNATVYTFFIGGTFEAQ